MYHWLDLRIVAVVVVVVVVVVLRVLVVVLVVVVMVMVIVVVAVVMVMGCSIDRVWHCWARLVFCWGEKTENTPLDETIWCGCEEGRHRACGAFCCGEQCRCFLLVE
jgi:hypothetical protein